LITCNRCGKENQDHYKFCLGCGNELARPVPAPAPTPAGPSALETARTVLPAAPQGGGQGGGNGGFGGGGNSTAGELQSAATPAPARPRSGIPWNDSPKMPSPLTPAPFVLPPNPLAAPAKTGPTPIGTPAVGPGLAATVASPAGAARPTSGGSPASGEIPCPNCGKFVQATFAFCGSCGARIAGRAPSGASGALGAQRTMHMAGSATAPSAVPRGRLILIRPDGSEGGAHPLHDGENLIGRGQGSLFDADAYLSPRHAEFVAGPDGVLVRDLRSLNGVFLRILTEESLESGDIFRIGQELLRFEVISPPQPLEDGTEIMGTPNPGFWGRLSVIVGRDVDGSAFPLFGDAIVLGRERGDILFPEDGYVSGTHARISLRDGQVFLSDLGSSNGTFLRLRHERTIPTGSFVLMGQQLFRLEFR
jgi:pSer/pThr/pTyr-binding forkhead associated (FHA) protein